MSGIYAKAKASTSILSSSTAKITAVVLSALLIGAGVYALGGGFNTTVTDDFPIIPIVNPSTTPIPDDENPFIIDPSPPDPTNPPNPTPTVEPIISVAVDPVGWGYAQPADFIVAGRATTNGTVYYGAYNTTSARWMVDWTSSNKTAVLASVASAASVGNLVSVGQGILSTYGMATCFVGNVSSATSAGQVCYDKFDGQYGLADASATATIGNGLSFVAIIDAAENGKTLLLTEGCFTLTSWNWVGGWIYVSDNTAGALEQTPHMASGEPDVAVGLYRDADTLQAMPYPLTVIDQP